jgi:hypothetical protein
VTVASIDTPCSTLAVDEPPAGDDRLGAVLRVADSTVDEAEALAGLRVESLGVVGHGAKVADG